MLVCTEHSLEIMDGNLDAQTPKVLPMAPGAFFTSLIPCQGAIYGVIESYDLLVGGATWEFVGAGWNDDGWAASPAYVTGAWNYQPTPTSNIPMRWMLWINDLVQAGETDYRPMAFPHDLYLQFNCGEDPAQTHPVFRCWLFWEES